MFNLQIHFNHPWLLLLLIPAVALALIPYFLLSKKYRRNRNRITSMVLFLIVMLLSTFVLAGMNFTYEINNSENEILLLVDVSYTTEEEKTKKDDYVNSVINMTNSNIYKLGVVTFGFDQKYVVPMTYDLSMAYNDYLTAELPDTTATDIAAALTYAESLFQKPEAAKIVLISDGLETDAHATSVIKSIASKGIRVDTVCCNTLSPESELQVVDAVLPDYNVTEGEKFNIALTLQNNNKEEMSADITIVDNGVESGTTSVKVLNGKAEVVLEHAFTEGGLHQLNFSVAAANDQDEVTLNNSLYSYMYLVPHDKVLIVEYFDGESEALKMLLEEKYIPTVVNVASDNMPKTLEQIRQYDEIILNNVANADLPEGFVKLLQSYVHDYGGGLFTVGGSEPSDIEDAHAYDREDMIGTLYQEMLPVSAINYTPPLGLAIIVDVSGSMSSSSSGVTKLDAAKNSAVTIVKDESCLSERDYCEILTLASDFSVEVRPLPMSKQDQILDAIYNIDGTGGTNFAPAMERASKDLRVLYENGDVEKMHVIVITDGAAADKEAYMEVVKYYHELGVTYSFVAIQAGPNDMAFLEEAATAGGGQAINSTAADLTIKLKDDIRVPEIKDVTYGEFTPKIDTDSSYSTIISQEEMPTLEGFYGTKKKTAAEVVLTGEFGVPIYAQWVYGKGMVGSFMCDLNQKWSANFMAAESGRRFLLSVVNKLFPAGDIRMQNIDVEMKEENYTTQLSIYTRNELPEDESITVEVKNLTVENATVSIAQPSAGNRYSRASFIAKEPGIYEIKAVRWKGEERVEERVVYKEFSYSAEYNMFHETDREAFMASLSASGNGNADTLDGADPYKVYDGFITSIQKAYDPRLLFIILALVLFLLDIAVRKFKFKWPHEIIRDLRAKKNRI